MATDSTLAVATREGTGTTASNALRRDGKIPGVLFGHGAPPLPVVLDVKSFYDVLHGGGKNALINLTIDGKPGETALVREVQRDPITRHVVHVDLQRVGASEMISASLPIVPVGVAEGVRLESGVMDMIVHSLQVRGPANKIPEQIEIDVTHLGVNDNLTAGEVKLPEGLSLDVDAHTTLIAIAAPRTEHAPAAEAGAEAEAPAPAAAESGS